MTTAADSSGNGHSGTYYNSTAIVTGLIPGDPDHAASFAEATNDYIAQDDTIAAQTFTAFTLGCIIKPDLIADSESPTIWGVVGIGQDSLLFFPDGSGKVVLEALDNLGNFFQLASGTTLSDGSTYRLIGTWDGTTARLYLNGMQDASVGYAHPVIFDAAEKFTVGADLNDVVDNITFNGTVDECFFVANHAASVGEIAAIDAAWTGTGSALTAVTALNPYIFWRLNGTSSTYRFSPPTEDTVSNVAYDVPAIWNRLRRFYPVGPRGKAVWKLPDDSFTFDQPYPSTEDTLVNRESLFPATPTPPSGLGTSTSNLTAVTYEYVYLGGHTYVVSAAEEALLAAFLTAQGYTASDWLVPV